MAGFDVPDAASGYVRQQKLAASRGTRRGGFVPEYTTNPLLDELAGGYVSPATGRTTTGEVPSSGTAATVTGAAAATIALLLLKKQQIEAAKKAAAKKAAAKKTVVKKAVAVKGPNSITSPSLEAAINAGKTGQDYSTYTPVVTPAKKTPAKKSTGATKVVKTTASTVPFTPTSTSAAVSSGIDYKTGWKPWSGHATYSDAEHDPTLNPKLDPIKDKPVDKKTKVDTQVTADPTDNSNLGGTGLSTSLPSPTAQVWVPRIY